MKCPSCGTQVADDAAVCPKCDAILDESLFSSEPGPSAPAPPPRRKPVKSSGVKPRAATGAAGSVPKKAPPKDANTRRPAMPDAPQRRSRTPPEQKAVAEDWHAAPSSLRPPPGPRAPGAYQPLDPEDWMTDVRHFIVGLSTSDKIAFWGALGTILACFFPWKETVDDGDALGLVSLGAFVFAACIILIIAMTIRVRNAMPRLNALVPWLLQFGTASFSIIWCLVFIKLSWDSTLARSPIGNYDMWTSKPSIGVFVALLLSIVALFGTLLGLREKPG